MSNLVPENQPVNTDYMSAAIALEKRLGGIEYEISNLRILYGNLLNEAKTRNGRIEKMESWRSKLAEEASFIAGRASMRKTDLAVLCAVFTALSGAIAVVVKLAI